MLRLEGANHKVSPETRERADHGISQILSSPGFWEVERTTGPLTPLQQEAQRIRARKGPLHWVGVGGSSLGPQMIFDLFGDPRRPLSTWDNLDPQHLLELAGTDEELRSSSFVFVSKSGSTLETLVALEAIHQRLSPLWPAWTEHALVLSEPGENPLTQWARSKKVPQIALPKDIGGRFSVFTPVGMFPVTVLGREVSEFHRGAQWALSNRDLAVEIAAQCLESFQRNQWVTLFWSYSSKLRFFNSWMIQLWAESLAKKTDLQGQPAPRVSTPWTAVGATDQHSLLQQVIEGARDKLVVFTRVEGLKNGIPFHSSPQFDHLHFLRGKSVGSVLDAEAVAIARALKREGISTLELELKDLSPASVAALWMTWMLVVAGMGQSLGINPFDQPGVELGKRLALEILNS